MKDSTQTLTPETANIEAFEERYRYDATYMKEMLTASPNAYQVFPVVKRAMGHYQRCAVTPLEI